MKVIAGEAHGQRLKAPRGMTTRPTSARVRESIFSRLAARLDFSGLAVLDLFAGSGALGIEALSRGAKNAVFVDSARAAAEAIRANLEALGLTSRSRLLCLDARRALADLAKEGACFDLVIADAPYQQGLSAQILAQLCDSALLAPGGWVVLELSRREAAPAEPGLESISVATLGDHRIALYRRAAQPE
ncbi:MAG TPA: 16S rRNA (guanine(966)-N(2))-methyltransferase RsmD [Candidatus Binataceae bacterium]|nr:16S rRNA (guanine(966)-N(2))-methyltransferase RsmD [Candidatus Binataceae bacterium]